jgi:hypothetical protein
MQQQAFRQSGCSNQQIHHVICLIKSNHLVRILFQWSIAFTETTYNCITKTLAKHKIKIVSILPREISSFFWPIRNYLALKHWSFIVPV